MHTTPPEGASRLAQLPPSLSWFLGYRRPTTSSTLQPKIYVIWIFSFIGSFASMAVLQAVFERNTYFVERNVPSIIASFAASAVLVFGAIEAPLAQPRALVFGHALSAVIGVALQKLFAHFVTDYTDIRWLPSSLATATSIVVMQMTATLHPPGGASALLPPLSPQIAIMGWYYVPIVILSASLMLVIGLLNNNIARRYPVFWVKRSEHVIVPQFQTPSRPVRTHSLGSKGEHIGLHIGPDAEDDERVVGVHHVPDEAVVVDKDEIIMPTWLELSAEEQAVLEGIQSKLHGNNVRNVAGRIMP
ncbi:HPP family-domain-containing protein [Fimicolochytrium jonesii]|uniref:HPP family-domain-containing protein n=1 Tax=Fimicolochytrium jonesii TaxID=1396493 RepID=UPI0022FE4D2D|nr:HPP family-domain-containing protein [Fimicolochytrium jonesii]KAI8817969.1 HPP family-domain-containing protein [Fimicolochytrium jonesii]